MFTNDQVVISNSLKSYLCLNKTYKSYQNKVIFVQVKKIFILPNKMIPTITNPATVNTELLPNEKLPKILASPAKSGTVSSVGSSSHKSFSTGFLDIISTSSEKGLQLTKPLWLNITPYSSNTATQNLLMLLQLFILCKMSLFIIAL